MLIRTIVFSVLAVSAASAGDVRVLALEGGEAPAGFDRLWSFRVPVIDDADRVVYRAGAGGSSVTTSPVYMVHTGTDAWVSLARGDGVPSGDGTFESFSDNVAINAAGQAVFHASLDDTSFSTDSGLYRLELDTGSITRLAREGNPTPAGGLFKRFEPDLSSRRLNMVNASGASVFVKDFYGDGVTSARDFAGFTADGNSTGYFAAEGDPFASTRQGSASLIGLSYATVNDAGDAAFYADLGGIFGDEGVYIARSGGIQTIANIDAAAPGGGVFSDFTPVLYTPINNAGQVAFWADVDLGVGGDPNRVFRGNGTTTTLIAKFGDPIPGTDESIYSIDRYIAMNEAGQVLLAGNDGPNGDYCLVVGDGISQTFIAIPGTTDPEGDVFDGTIQSYAINDAGQVAFVARTDSPGGSTAYGLYLHTPGGGTERLLREGETLGGLTINDIDFRGIEDAGSNRGDGLSNSGAVCFRFDSVERIAGIAAASLPAGCSQADLAQPFGLLDLADITRFITAFVAGGSDADLDQNGLFDLADITGFVAAFLDGCP
jgi:hypothetical protein